MSETEVLNGKASEQSKNGLPKEIAKRLEGKNYIIRVEGEGSIVNELNKLNEEYGVLGLPEPCMFPQMEVLREIRQDVEKIGNARRQLISSLDNVELQATPGLLGSVKRFLYGRQQKDCPSAYDLVKRECEVGNHAIENFGRMVRSNKAALDTLVVYAASISTGIGRVVELRKEYIRDLEECTTLGRIIEEALANENSCMLQEVRYQNRHEVQWKRTEVRDFGVYEVALRKLRPDLEDEIMVSIDSMQLAKRAYVLTRITLDAFANLAPIKLNRIRDDIALSELQKILGYVRESSIALDKKAAEGYKDLQNFSVKPTSREEPKEKGLDITRT